jgi:hypothetical protein
VKASSAVKLELLIAEPLACMPLLMGGVLVGRMHARSLSKLQIVRRPKFPIPGAYSVAAETAIHPYSHNNWNSYSDQGASGI